MTNTGGKSDADAPDDESSVNGEPDMATVDAELREVDTDAERGDAEAAEGDAEEEDASTGYLPTLPETFVTLGAGCLATATMLTALAFGYVLWMIATGTTRTLAGYQVYLAAGQMAFATALLGVGAYSALKRIRWTLVVVAALLGSFAFITIPFTAVAVVCIGLGREHFSANLVE